MSKKQKKKRPLAEAENNKDIKEIAARNVARLLVLVALTIITFCFYRFLLEKFNDKYVLIAYMSVATVVILSYVIYNRGFSRKGLTVEMLPKEWSDEEKTEFIEDGNRRLVRSRPLLMLSFAFIFTFVIDIIELFAIPLLQEIFGK